MRVVIVGAGAIGGWLGGGLARAGHDVAFLARGRTLAALRRDGLIVRTPDPTDRRSAAISLTQRVEARALVCFAAAREVGAVALEALSPDERAPFLGMMRRIIGRLETDQG